ncbi:MAG: hypothetical protein RSA84_20535, partial [Acinetobacter sp.]
QGHPPPANTALAYPVSVYYGKVLFWSVLSTTNASALMAGHTLTATIRQSGVQPGTSAPYPTAIFAKYTYSRNGRPNDVLGAELTDPQNYLRNVDYYITLTVFDSSGTLIGACRTTTFKFI